MGIVRPVDNVCAPKQQHLLFYTGFFLKGRFELMRENPFPFNCLLFFWFLRGVFP